MIAPNSPSYPIAGAALAVGITYAEAYGYVWANRNLVATRNMAGPEGAALVAAWERIVDAHGQNTMVAFQERIEAAIMDGLIYWPYPAWFLDRAERAEEGSRYERIEEDADAGDLPEQPEAPE